MVIPGVLPYPVEVVKENLIGKDCHGVFRLLIKPRVIRAPAAGDQGLLLHYCREPLRDCVCCTITFCLFRGTGSTERRSRANQTFQFDQLAVKITKLKKK